MRFIQQILWILTVGLMTGPALAQSFLEDQPDFTTEGEIVITEDDVYRFARTRLEFDILTARITYRSALGVEDPMAVYEDYILGAERMFRANDLTKTHYNDILLAINHVPEIERVAIAAFRDMPAELIELATPVETYEQLLALMDGHVSYIITPDMVPWLKRADSDVEVDATQAPPSLPRALQGFPQPEALFPNMEIPQ